MLPLFLLQVVWPWQFYQLVPAISYARSLSWYLALDLTENKTNISICWYAVALSIVVKIRISNAYLVKVIKRGIVSLINNASENPMYVYTRSFSSIHDLGLWCLTPTLVDETGIPAENHRLSASHYHTFTSRTAINIYDKCRLNKNMKTH